MSRVTWILSLASMTPIALPERCARPEREATAPPASTAAPNTPAFSATAPPIWTAPEVASAEPVAAPESVSSPELTKARALAEAGEPKKVRALLEKKARAGKATREEAALLVDACTLLRDKACIELAKAKLATLEGPRGASAPR